MKILTILGSPRPRGNTAAVLACFEALLRGEHTVERINITDYDILGCLGCDGCQEFLDCPGCVQEDAMQEIFPRILAADLVVYAAPVYCWGFPAQMKALLDRQYCLVKYDQKPSLALLHGKRVMLLATCGGEAESNFDLMREAFAREADYLECVVAGSFVVDNCSDPGEPGMRARLTAEAMRQAALDPAR